MTDLSAWPALVLTAGLATRLAPLSNVRAKAAIPVAGQPLVARVLRWLKQSGVTRVVLNLHHRPETITGLVGDGAEWDIAVRYSWETRVLGTAGGPRHALPLLDAERFLIVNGDTLTDCDLSAVVSQHTKTGASVTMAVVPGDVDRYGAVWVGERDVVHRFGKKAGDGRPLHFIGVQAVESDVFATLPAETPGETVSTLYPLLIQRRLGDVQAYVSDAEFLDVGTAADYLATVATIAAREHHGFDQGIGCDIHRSATVERSVLWDHVIVSERTQLIECIVADGVVIPPGSRYERCAIVNGRDGLLVTPF